MRNEFEQLMSLGDLSQKNYNWRERYQDTIDMVVRKLEDIKTSRNELRYRKGLKVALHKLLMEACRDKRTKSVPTDIQQRITDLVNEYE